MEGTKAVMEGTKAKPNGSSNHVDNVIEMHEKLEENEEMYKEMPKPNRSCLPDLFERSKMGLLNPRFDSTVLERKLVEAFFPQDRRKFRSALIYVMVLCVAWVVYFSCTIDDLNHWEGHIGGACAMVVVSFLFFIATYLPLYSRHYYKASVIFSLCLCTLSLLRYAYVQEEMASGMAMSAVGSFCSLIEIVLLLYNLLPLPLYLAVGLSFSYSVIYEAVFLWKMTLPSAGFIVGKILLHLCVHLVCISLFLMTSVRKHSTFWRIGQSTMARKQLKEEKRLKEDIIYSLMPENVAKEAMQNRNYDDQEVSDVLVVHKLGVCHVDILYLCV